MTTSHIPARITALVEYAAALAEHHAVTHDACACGRTFRSPAGLRNHTRAVERNTGAPLSSEQSAHIAEATRTMPGSTPLHLIAERAVVIERAAALDALPTDDEPTPAPVAGLAADGLPPIGDPRWALAAHRGAAIASVMHWSPEAAAELLARETGAPIPAEADDDAFTQWSEAELAMGEDLHPSEYGTADDDEPHDVATCPEGSDCDTCAADTAARAAAPELAACPDVTCAARVSIRDGRVHPHPLRTHDGITTAGLCPTSNRPVPAPYRHGDPVTPDVTADQVHDAWHAAMAAQTDDQAAAEGWGPAPELTDRHRHLADCRGCALLHADGHTYASLIDVPLTPDELRTLAAHPDATEGTRRVAAAELAILVPPCGDVRCSHLDDGEPCQHVTDGEDWSDVDRETWAY
jgi:hypothetical protein